MPLITEVPPTTLSRSALRPWLRRIAPDLELNLRIKPRPKMKQEKPEELAVPEAPNQDRSMDFRADCLVDGSSSGC